MTTNKQTLSLKPSNGFAFNCRPAFDIELDASRILCNDISLPDDHNPHNVRLWVIGNEYGPLCAVWASHEQDAMDEAMDAGFLDSFKVEPENEEELDGCAFLGNAGEPCNLDYAWMQEVNLTPELIAKFRIAADECYTALDQVPA